MSRVHCLIGLPGLLDSIPNDEARGRGGAGRIQARVEGGGQASQTSRPRRFTRSHHYRRTVVRTRAPLHIEACTHRLPCPSPSLPCPSPSLPTAFRSTSSRMPFLGADCQKIPGGARLTLFAYRPGPSPISSPTHFVPGSCQ